MRPLISSTYVLPGLGSSGYLVYSDGESMVLCCKLRLNTQFQSSFLQIPSNHVSSFRSISHSPNTVRNFLKSKIHPPSVFPLRIVCPVGGVPPLSLLRAPHKHFCLTSGSTVHVSYPHFWSKTWRDTPVNNFLRRLSLKFSMP